MRQKLVTPPQAAYRCDLELGETNPTPLQPPLPPCTFPGCNEIPHTEWEGGVCGRHVTNMMADDE